MVHLYMKRYQNVIFAKKEKYAKYNMKTGPRKCPRFGKRRQNLG